MRTLIALVHRSSGLTVERWGRQRSWYLRFPGTTTKWKSWPQLLPYFACRMRP